MNHERRKSLGYIGGIFALFMGFTSTDSNAARRSSSRSSSSSGRSYSSSSSHSSRTYRNSSYRVHSNSSHESNYVQDHNGNTEHGYNAGSTTRQAKKRESGYNYIVTANQLNVREKARIDSAIIGKLKKGTKVKVIGIPMTNFYKISFGDNGGYVYRNYVRHIKK